MVRRLVLVTLTGRNGDVLRRQADGSWRCDRLPLRNGLMTSSNREQYSHRRSCIVNSAQAGG
jgi:hypothetical protein